MRLLSLAWLRTLRGRLIAGLALLVAGIVAGTLIGVAAFRALTTEFTDDLRTLDQWADATATFEAGVLEMVGAGQAYMGGRGGGQGSSTQGSEAAATRFSHAADATHTQLLRLRSLRDLTADDRILIGRLAEQQALVEVEYALAHAYFDTGKGEESRAATARARGAVDSLTASIRELTRRQAGHSGEVTAHVQATARARELPLLGLLLLSAVAGVGIAWVILRGIEGPLDRLAAAAGRVGQGDLRPVETGGMLAEFEALAGAFNAMGGRLRQIVGDVVQESERITASAGDLSAVSEQIAASSGEITNSMMEVSRGAESQAARLAEAHEGLAELGAQTGEVETAAVRATALGENIRTIAEQHQRDVSRTLVALTGVQKTVKTSAAEVAKLAESSEAIDEFVSLVKRIASQTNLLALNAAIEAARAGEHGRGFAVVAEEVRKLADESAAGAERVAGTLTFIRGQVERVTTVMEDGLKNVRGVETVSQAMAKGLQDILGAVAGVEQSARLVSTTASRNRVAAEAVGVGVAEAADQAGKHAGAAESVTAAAEQQSASTQEMASAASELLRAAERLREVVSGFQL